MPELPTDWDNYQVPVDSSVPNPVAPTAGKGHGRDTGRGGIGLKPDLQLIPLGGGYSVGWRRLVSLGTAALGAMVVAAALTLPWAVIREGDGFRTQAILYWDNYPNACATLVAVTAASLALICTHRARYLVTILNASAILLIVYTTGQTLHANASLDVGTAPNAHHLMGPAWLTLLTGALLNLIASVVQPPRPAG
jgi:hypothetical protein